jgi:hypothetical protein
LLNPVSRQAVAAAELAACELISDFERRNVLRTAEKVFQGWESGEHRYAAEAAMAAVSDPKRDQVDSFLSQQGYFYYVTQHMRWIGSRCGSWSVVNTYEGCFRGLLLKEPKPPPLHPRARPEPYRPIPPSKYRYYDGT